MNSLAQEPLTRHDTLLLLKHHDRDELFPASQNTPEKLAESDLVRYLLHENEADELVTKTELLKTEENLLCFQMVFRCCRQCSFQ